MYHAGLGGFRDSLPPPGDPASAVADAVVQVVPGLLGLAADVVAAAVEGGAAVDVDEIAAAAGAGVTAGLEGGLGLVVAGGVQDEVVDGGLRRGAGGGVDAGLDVGLGDGGRGDGGDEEAEGGGEVDEELDHFGGWDCRARGGRVGLRTSGGEDERW